MYCIEDVYVKLHAADPADLEVRVGNRNTSATTPPAATNNNLCWITSTTPINNTVEFRCFKIYPAKGRYVSVQRRGVNGSLALCEVQVGGRKEGWECAWWGWGVLQQ